MALLLAVAGRSAPAGAEPSQAGADDGAEAAEQAEPAAAVADEAKAAAADPEADGEGAVVAKPKRQRRGGGRTKHHGRFEGRVVPDDDLRQEPLDPPSGNLEVFSPGLNEGVKVNIYNEDGSYNIESLHALDHVLRCRRTNDEKPIEPRLFVLLSHVYDHFGDRRLEIVSGYRNQRKKTSNHYKGSASDIRIAGVTPKKVEAFAETLDTGGMGIGIYPRSQFVHIDVRPLPSYRWTDYSPPNPNAPEKRPPRGWKRKKLQS
jgi:hypothetical protein